MGSLAREFQDKGVKENMELIYIGDEFYSRSRTMMSSIYTIDGKRSDWGFVSLALKSGESVSIRPATEEELIPYKKMLEEMESRY